LPCICLRQLVQWPFMIVQIAFIERQVQQITNDWPNPANDDSRLFNPAYISN
jgi:hypothetical protein